MIGEAAVDQLVARFRGRVLTPGDANYDEARKVWNGTIDRKPAVIARCTGVSDVITALRFARENGLLMAVRGGGHSFPGHSVCDDGIVIDLSEMKGIQVDLNQRTARAQAGATWGDLDHETQAFGLAAPGGVVSQTGIAGLTLGGGCQSWLVRKYGTTVDNLLGVNIVTADGTYLRANAEENADLFWAVRGGGGNFGIVTSFDYRLHPVGPIVLAGAAFFPWHRAQETMDFYLDFVTRIPDELTTAVYFWTAPPAPFLPESAHGRLFTIIALCYSGDLEDGVKVVEPIRAMQPEIDMIGPLPYVTLQSMYDAVAPHGCLIYGKSDYFEKFSSAAVKEILERTPTMLSPQSFLHLNHYGGAVRKIAPDATPFAHRSSDFAFSINALWTDVAESEKNAEWVREFWQAMRAHSPQGAYVNFLTDEGEDRVRESYGANYDRLAAVKARFDPENVFRLNQNIKPCS